MGLSMVGQILGLPNFDKRGKGKRSSDKSMSMPTMMAAADVFISRAGASSCNEIAAAGVPCILIPSPNVTDNHQEKNARSLEAVGAAEVLLDKDCTAQALMERINGLLQDKQRWSAMRAALQSISVPDCAERLCGIMESLIRHR